MSAKGAPLSQIKQPNATKNEKTEDRMPGRRTGHRKPKTYLTNTQVRRLVEYGNAFCRQHGTPFVQWADLVAEFGGKDKINPKTLSTRYNKIKKAEQEDDSDDDDNDDHGDDGGSGNDTANHNDNDSNGDADDDTSKNDKDATATSAAGTTAAAAAANDSIPIVSRKSSLDQKHRSPNGNITRANTTADRSAASSSSPTPALATTNYGNGRFWSCNNMNFNGSVRSVYIHPPKSASTSMDKSPRVSVHTTATASAAVTDSAAAGDANAAVTTPETFQRAMNPSGMNKQTDRSGSNSSGGSDGSNDIQTKALSVHSLHSGVASPQAAAATTSVAMSHFLSQPQSSPAAVSVSCTQSSNAQFYVTAESPALQTSGSSPMPPFPPVSGVDTTSTLGIVACFKLTRDIASEFLHSNVESKMFRCQLVPVFHPITPSRSWDIQPMSSPYAQGSNTTSPLAHVLFTPDRNSKLNTPTAATSSALIPPSPPFDISNPYESLNTPQPAPAQLVQPQLPQPQLSTNIATSSYAPSVPVPPAYVH